MSPHFRCVQSLRLKWSTESRKMIIYGPQHHHKLLQLYLFVFRKTSLFQLKQLISLRRHLGKIFFVVFVFFLVTCCEIVKLEIHEKFVSLVPKTNGNNFRFSPARFRSLPVGMPQGSTLGPPLFAHEINDAIKTSQKVLGKFCNKICVR